MAKKNLNTIGIANDTKTMQQPQQQQQQQQQQQPQLYSQSTIDEILTPTILKHQKALQKRNETRQWCSSQLRNHRQQHHHHQQSNSLSTSLSCPPYSSLTSTIDTYRRTIQNLQTKLLQYQEECQTKSVLSASQSVQIQERIQRLEESRNKVQRMKFGLDSLYSSVLVSNEQNADNTDDGVGSVGSVGSVDEGKHHDKNGNDKENEDETNTNEVGARGTNTTSTNTNLSSTIHAHIQDVKQHRFQLALQVFTMHRMDVGEEYNQLTFDELLRLSTVKPSSSSITTSTTSTTNDKKASFKQNPTSSNNNNTNNTNNHKNQHRFQRRIHSKQPSGIGKICDMPIPHAGQELYSVLPPNYLSSSLRLIANLTSLLGRCLGIVLPHPILLRPLLLLEEGGEGEIENEHREEDGKKKKQQEEEREKQRYYSSRRRKYSKSSKKNIGTSTNVYQEDKEILLTTTKTLAMMNNIEKWFVQETGDITVSRLDTVNDSANVKTTTMKDFEDLVIDDKDDNNNCIDDGNTSDVNGGSTGKNGDTILYSEKNHDHTNHGVKTKEERQQENNYDTIFPKQHESNNNMHDMEKEWKDTNYPVEGYTTSTTPAPSSSTTIGSSLTASSGSLMSLVGSSSNILSRSARRAFVKIKKGTSSSSSLSNNNNMNHNHHKPSIHNMAKTTTATTESIRHQGKNNRDNNDPKKILLVRKMDDISIKNRISHASYAMICESNKANIIGGSGSTANHDDDTSKFQTNNLQNRQESSFSTSTKNTTSTTNNSANSNNNNNNNHSNSNTSMSTKQKVSPHLVQYELRPPPPRKGRATVGRGVVGGVGQGPGGGIGEKEDHNFDREKECFTIGLQLLQNNIIALSIQAGVPIATLWPAEAMLLNLHSLRLYCLSQCSKRGS